MARQKAFDQEKALNNAMQLFWRKGYEGASMQALLTEMGIGRGSLYDTFGGKRQLFQAALARYRASSDTRLVAPLYQPGPVPDAIRTLFDNLVEQALADPEQKGCLLVNSAVELGPHDAEIAREVATAVSSTEEAFYQAILRGQAVGEVGAAKDARALARFFVNNVRGIRVLARLNPQRQALEDIVSVTLAALE
ncbi:MAG: TetR/AcrR family transcriptional regulator [Anaerolineales bacterium]|nr:TetR/AcrR family transcriptional regulator [Anaerolineales bacterium]